ncbi:MAG: ABC transporter permease [Alphaproteobacteria bacterium]
MRRLSTIFWSGYAGLMVMFMLTPLALVVLFSFGKSKLTNFPMGGLSFTWYDAIFQDPAFWAAFWNSMIVSGFVCLVSTLVGTAAAMVFARMPPKLSGVGIIMLCLPIMLPALVLGIAALAFYVSIGLPLGLFTVILSHVVITQPFVILIVYARMLGFDYAALESARDLGAGPLRAFLTVTLPIIRATVIGAALIALAISLDEFIITFFTISGGNTLPTLVFGMLRRTLGPQINAIGTLLLALTVGSTLIALWITRYRG